MRSFKKYLCIVLSALMSMSALCGCGAEEPEEEERFSLSMSLCARLDSLDPAMNTDPRAESVFYALYENLMRVEEDDEGNFTVVPGIAKEYRTVENADGTVDYVFTLRSSARWSDGSRVRARDFAYAWRRLADPTVGSPNCDLLSMVQGYQTVRETGDLTQLGVKADGDTTFRVTLAAPCAFFIREICTAVATMPLPSDKMRSDPDVISTSSTLCDGAYQVGVWAREEYIQLRRNSSYYERRSVEPDVLRFLFSAGEEQAQQLYDSKTLDLAVVLPAGTEGEAYLPLRSTVCVLYNHMSDVFSNARVRRAFDLSLDRTAIAAAAGAGTVPAAGLVPPGILGVSAEAEEDFRGAGAALCDVDEEGYSMRCLAAEHELRNGGYWGGVGFPSVQCIYVAGEETRRAAAATTSIWNERLKVAISTEGLTRAEFDRRIAAGEYDVAIDTLQARFGDALEFLAPFAGTDGSNVLHYVSKPFDLLIGVASGSRDPAARTAFLHDAEALLLDDTALSPLYFRAEAYRLRDGLTGLQHDQRGNLFFTGVSRADSVE